MDLEAYTVSQPNQSNNRESWSDKALRELELAGVGFKAIPNAAAEAITERPVETGLKVVAAAGLSLALGYATSKAGPLRGIAQSVGLSLGVSAIGDFGRNLSPVISAFADNWESRDNWDRNSAVMRDRFAPFVFDTALTMTAGVAGGYGGARMARAQAFEPMLPQLTQQGFLPPGIHKASWQEFATKFGTTPRRKDLVANMEVLLQEAKQHAPAGEKVYIGGSMVSPKPTPKDFDMTWKISGEQVGVLREKAPLLVDRTMQSQKLGGELMVTYPNAPDGSVLAFLQRNNRYSAPGSYGPLKVGVVEIDLATIPSRTSYRLRSLLGRAGERPITDIAKTEPFAPMPKNSPY